MLHKTQAQVARGTAMARTGQKISSLVCLLLLAAFGLRAQNWPGTFTILESDPEPGDTVTLVVSVGSAGDSVSDQGSLLATISYEVGSLSYCGPGEVDVQNSFFVASGIDCSTAVEVDETEGEITLEITLKSPYTGSGYGELARLKGIMILEDVFKKPMEQPEPVKNDLFAFPNPSAGLVTVALPGGQKGRAWLTDVAGRTVLRTEVQERQSTLEFDLDGIPEGTYFLHLPGREGYRPQMLVVRR